MSGAGCPECARIDRIRYLTRTHDEFIGEAIKIHGDLYGYGKVKYENDNKVKEKLVTIEKELLLYKNREMDYINKIKILEQNIFEFQSVKKEIQNKDNLIKYLP